MPNEYFTHEKSRVEGRREHLSRSYNRHPESKKSKIKRETEEDWSSLIGKMEKKKEILSYYYKFLLASVDATRITAIYYFLH